jgi:glycosyltransferase involved in cell wall biosynthesis
MSARPTVLMPVYNEIDYDGRVQRAAAALAEHFDVTVLCIDSGNPAVRAGFPFAIEPVALPPAGRFKARRHLAFWRHLWRAARRRRPAVIHAHDYYLAWPGWATARLSGARFVYDAHELIVPEPGERQSRRERLFYQLERWTVGRADLVIAANDRRAELMREHYRLARTPLVVGNVPPAPQKRADLEEVLGRWPRLRRTRPGSVRVVYQGDIDLDRGLGVFVEAMKLLEERFEIVFVGGGPHVEALGQRCTEAGLGERAVVAGRIPRADLEAFLPACDVGIITYSTRGLNCIYCAPNKIYEYSQAGLPCLAVGSDYLCELVQRGGIGLGIPRPRASAEAVAAALTALGSDLGAYRAACARFAREHGWEQEMARLMESYCHLLAEHKGTR